MWSNKSSCNDNLLTTMMHVEWKGKGELGWISEISNTPCPLGFFVHRPLQPGFQDLSSFPPPEGRTRLRPLPSRHKRTDTLSCNNHKLSHPRSTYPLSDEAAVDWFTEAHWGRWSFRQPIKRTTMMWEKTRTSLNLRIMTWIKNVRN